MIAVKALVVACGLAILAALPATAHPLPSTIVTYRVDANSLDVTLTIPLHELALALPAVKALGETPAEAAVTGDLLPQLADYFAGHMALVAADHSALVLGMTDARIGGAEHEDIGHYALLVVDLSAPIKPSQQVFPTTLTYDAVMHEVRNHRAEVFSQSLGKDPKAVGGIRFDPDLGAAAGLDLPQP
jgi:hypothetical protein